jgi:hypothetical protein
MREFINIVEGFMQPAFGRKGVAPTRQITPAPSQYQDEVKRASEYGSAEEYADAYNSIFPMNTDRPAVHANYQREREQLMQRWNTFRHNNWL